MDEMNPRNPPNPPYALTGKGGNSMPDVYVKFAGRMVGRVVNNRTGEVLKVLVQMRKYKGTGPVSVSAVDPQMVEAVSEH